MYLRPETLDETVEALHRHGGRVLSGETDVFPSRGDAPLSGTVVDLSAVRELSRISVADDGIRTIWSAIARAELPRAFDALEAADREVRAVRIPTAPAIREAAVERVPATLDRVRAALEAGGYP